MARILIIDDEQTVCDFLAQILENNGHSTLSAQTLTRGLELAQAHPADIVLLDVNMPDGSGLDIMPELRSTHQAPEVIIITGAGDIDDAMRAMNNGAWDYVQKPLSATDLIPLLDRALEYRRSLSYAPEQPLPDRGNIVGNSPELTNCLRQVSLAASGDANILILGETGTGKEMFAQVIHKNSRRSDKPFVTVDCAALSKTLGESSLFGHRKGAFTGADHTHDGLVAQAHGGTLFLDEVGELTLEMQKIFLRLLQERTYRPLGSKQTYSSDFRLIAATNRNLGDMVAAGEYRADLYFRLRGIAITLPALRQRPGDIRLLVEHHAAQVCSRLGIAPKLFSPDFMEAVSELPWPGNVRELFNTVEAAINISGSEPIIYAKHLPADVRVHRLATALEQPLPTTRTATTSPLPPYPSPQAAMPSALLVPDSRGDLPTLKAVQHAACNAAEQQYLTELMFLTNGDIKEACAISGLSRSRLYLFMKKHGVKRPN